MPKQPKHLEGPSLCSRGFSGPLPVGDFHTDFSQAVQGSHGQGSEGQRRDSSSICGTCPPLLQAAHGTGGSWVTHRTSARCGIRHDATALRRDRGWEEMLGWGTSGWNCPDVGAEGGPNGGKTGLKEASRTATLYILRGGP